MSSHNPYSDPTYTLNPSTPPIQPSGSFDSQWTILGIVFIILAVLGLFFGAAGTVGNAIQFANGQNAPPPNMDENGKKGYYVGLYGSYAIMAVSTIVQPLIIWAGVNMLRRKGRLMILVGSIAACVPGVSSCCILAIPFGIWSLVLLTYPESKRLIP